MTIQSVYLVEAAGAGNSDERIPSSGSKQAPQLGVVDCTTGGRSANAKRLSLALLSVKPSTCVCVIAVVYGLTVHWQMHFAVQQGTRRRLWQVPKRTWRILLS